MYFTSVSASYRLDRPRKLDLDSGARSRGDTGGDVELLLSWQDRRTYCFEHNFDVARWLYP